MTYVPLRNLKKEYLRYTKKQKANGYKTLDYQEWLEWQVIKKG